MNPCPTRQQLQQLLAGQLPDDLERGVSAHLESCAACQQVMEQLTTFQSRPLPEPTGVPPAAGPARRTAAPPAGTRPRLSDVLLRRMQDLLPTCPPTISVMESAPAPTAGPDWPAVPGYEVLRELGRGGMAVVYEARQLRPNRLVALKMIQAGDLASPEQLVRFCTEGEIVAGLRHANIVQIYEVGTYNKQPYLALELMDGGSLAEAQAGIPLPARAAAALVQTLAGAIDYAHRQGIVHRDLNPANVLLSLGRERPAGADSSFRDPIHRTSRLAEAVPKIADFGLAKHLGQDSRLTQTGNILGTPSYMAPEQVRGQNDRTGPATDVYALGAILYEALTGRPPFLADTCNEVMNQVRELDPVAPSRLLPRVPRDLEVICLKCLEKEPARRYASAADLADDLRRSLAGEPIQAPRVSALERGWRWARRRPAVAGLLLALAAALLAGTLFSTYFAAESAGRADLALQREREATAAQAQSAQQSAELLLDRGLKRAAEGQVAEALHWMLASLRASPDPDFRRLVRIHLASWGTRVPTLEYWLDTPHRQAAFSPDGRLVVTAGKPGPEAGDEPVSLQFWDLPGGRPLGEPVRTDDLDMRSLAFSPDGQTLLAANGSIQRYQGQPGWATVWDVARRQVRGQFAGHDDCLLGVAWTPDGGRVLTGSRDRTVRVWDATTRQPVGRPWPHPSEVRSLAVSPDGRWALTRAVDSAHLWEIATGEPVGGPIRPGVGTVLSVAFGGDGRTLLVGGVNPGGKGYRWFAQRFDPVKRCLLGQPHGAPHPSCEIAVVPDGRAPSPGRASEPGRPLVSAGHRRHPALAPGPRPLSHGRGPGAAGR